MFAFVSVILPRIIFYFICSDVQMLVEVLTFSSCRNDIVIASLKMTTFWVLQTSTTTRQTDAPLCVRSTTTSSCVKMLTQKANSKLQIVDANFGL